MKRDQNKAQRNKENAATTNRSQQNQNQSKQTRMGFFVLGRRSGGFTHV
jgi:hypothetical protein